MPDDVLEKLSSVIGRKVEPINQPAKNAPDTTLGSGEPASLEKIIGRPLTPIKMSPIAQSRFDMYSQALKNGFDSQKAAKVAMQTAGTMNPAQESITQRVKRGISEIPLGGGRTIGDATADLGRMYRSAVEKLNNPGGSTDKEWEEAKKAQQEFFERHLGKGFAAGAATGTAEFGEQMLSPIQIALLVGTFGESALARTAAKIGVAGAVPAARTLAKLIQLQFASQMIEGAATGVENTARSLWNGDWETAGKSAVEGLASGLMAKGIVSHEQAISKVRGDLEKVAREKYGVPGEGIKAAITSRFDQLNPYQQGLVIDETVKRSPEYQETLNLADQQNSQARERTKKQRERKLNDYYGRAIEQSWEPNVAKRTIRNLQRGRERGTAMAAEDARKQSIADVVRTIREAAEKRARSIDEEYERKRQEGIAERPDKRQAAAEARTERQKYASEIANRREDIFKQRDETQTTPIEEVPARQVEAVVDDQGHMSYPAHYWGEENSFGVSSDFEGHSIYRQTPRGVEWLDEDGNFSEEPTSLFASHDPETPDTIARLSALSADADNLNDAAGATKEQKADAEKLADIRRNLISGEIDAKEAQRQAGIGERGTLPDEITAARDGRLNGPFHESSPAEFYENLQKEAESLRTEEPPISNGMKRIYHGSAEHGRYEGPAWFSVDKDYARDYRQGAELQYVDIPIGKWKELSGEDLENGIPGSSNIELDSSETGLRKPLSSVDEDIKTILDEAGLLARQQTENNLHHVYRPGDYIISKQGVKWILDSKGVLHPDNGGNSVPLMKNGLYSNQALQLAASGRVGYGTITREERRLEAARQRSIEEEIRNKQEEVNREMRLAVQRQGLQTSTEFESRADIEEKMRREMRRLSRPPAPPGVGQAEQLTRMIFAAPAEPEGVIRSIASAKGVPVEEVMRIALANDPALANTPEAQVARLEVGDSISDDFRKDRPWIVEKGAGEQLVLRSGNANPIPLDRLNPSDRVKQIVSRGTITRQGSEFSSEEVARAAFEKPHYFSHQEDLTQQVQERMEGKVRDPEPRNVEQAKSQAETSSRRASAAESVATRALAEAIEPTSDTVEKAEENAAKADEQIKIAEEAYAQSVEAQVKTQPQEVFLQKSPATLGIRGRQGKIIQNNREIPFHYELLPLEGLVTSHKWEGNKLIVNEDYPSELQPRTISENESLQNAMRAQRRVVDERGLGPGYNFAEYVDKTVNGSMGPAIVEEGGRVVGGNTRIAIMRRHLEELKKISDSEERQAALDGFKSAMRKLAKDSDIESYPNDGKDYVVVRMMDTPVDNTRQAAELGRLFNKPVGVQITKSARGVSFSKALDESILEEIGRRIDNYDGIAQAIQADPAFFRGIVVDRFGIDPVEYVDWFEDKPGKELTLHDQGREQFTKALLGTLIKDTSILNKIEGKTPYRALERALPYIVRMRAIADRDVSSKIVEAAQAAADTVDTDASLANTKDLWSATYHPDQQGLPGMDLQLPPEPDRVVEALWRAMHAGPRVLNDRLKGFLENTSSKGGILFDEIVKTPAEAFNKVFHKELREVQVSRGDKHFSITQDEFDAAMRNQEMSDVERNESHEKKEAIKKSESVEVPKAKGITPPPKPPKAIPEAERKIAEEKTQQGYVTPQQLREFLEQHPATKDNAPELMRTAQMMAEFVYDTDPPVGVDRKQALDWVLKERLAGIESGELKGKRGQYSDPNIEKQFGDKILRLHKSSDPTTFIHEFAHVIFPLLSNDDLQAIDTIRGPRDRWSGLPTYPTWDGDRKNLKGDVYAGLSEKLANGLEHFLRDENPTGFTAEVKAVLAKVKDIMRKVYMKFVGDPLSEYRNTEESREVFSKMFGITDFDVADKWREEVKKARAEENKMKKPDEALHPLAKMASESKAIGIAKSIEGRVEDSVGDRVDPKQPVAVLRYANIEDAVAVWATIGEEGSRIQNAELIQSPDGTWGIKFNTKNQVPTYILYQPLPERHPGVELEDLKKRLAATPSFKMMERKLLELKIANLEKQIRAKFGFEEAKPESNADLATQTLREVKDAKATERVRTGTDAVPGFPKPERTGGIPKPPKLGVSGHAGTEQRGGAGGRPVAGVGQSLAKVNPVGLLPLSGDRGAPVGTVKGEVFNEKAWKDSIKKAGLPENSPPPTWALDRKTADKLIFPGQKQIAQLALSALDQGDGFVLASATGTGKTYHSMAVVKEWRSANPEAKVLVITKNVGLLKSAQQVAENTFGFDVIRDIKDEPGVYGTTYQKMIMDKSLLDHKWDLVVADESGEARRWYADENKQGKRLKEIIENSKKALYLSATPFHSPQEYGYLDKLNLWPKGEFDKWIEQNFAHEKIGDKIVAKLDPAKQAKLRQQLIERGQLVSQAISYEGFTAHFGVIPVTDVMRRNLNRIREGFSRARSQFLQKGKKGLAEKTAAFEATYTKAYLERERIPQAIELAKKARQQGWQVMIFSETSAEDLFRRQRIEGIEPSTYQQLDDAMGGQLSKIIPPFGNVYDNLHEEFGDQIADYSGRGNTMAERDKAKADFLSGKTPMLYTTYAAGGIGVSLHDADYPEMGIKGGDKPRVAIFLGPPYSGVLLEQAMGRPWRFGVKSDVHAVFLATDSEPDIKLMQMKVGPRMRALRAAVLGEKDSLASAMSSYNDEEKVRARQDALAYAEGDEIKVNAASFNVRSKSRDVGINDWSAINFPSADMAKNKGMRYGEEVPGGDWSTLFQSKFKMYEPESPADAIGNETVDAIGDGLASGQGLPEGVSVQNLDPADRDVVTGAATAVAVDDVEIPVDRDKEATARQSMQAQLNMPGDRNKWVLTYPKGSKMGVWKYLGNPEDLKPVDASGRPDTPHDIKTFYLGNIFTQEIGIKAIARRAKTAEVGNEIVRMNRSYQADRDVNFSQFSLMADDIMRRNKIDPRDKKAIGEIWDVVEGKWTTGDPAIEKAANEISSLMEMINDELANADVKIKTPTGQFIPFSKMTRDRRYMPHRIDWNATVEDPLSGEKHTLKEVMGKTFADAKRERIIQAIAQSSGSTYTEVMDYLNQYKPSTPVLGHVHRARVMNFPIIKKDWPTLMAYFDQAAEAIAIEKNFGSDREKLNKVIDKIPSFNGRNTIRSMFDSQLEPQDWQNAASKFYNAMIGYEALTKMTLSAAKVPYHMVHIPLSLGGRVLPTIKAMARTVVHPHRAMENATYVGTVARQLNVADLIGQGAEKGLAHEVFKKTMFQAFYRWGRVIAGESARVWMEQHAMNDLKKGGRTAEEARRMLRDTMLVGDKAIDDAVAQSRWSPDDLAKAQTAFANYTMFSDNSLQMPGWARLEVRSDTPSPMVALHRALRLTYALQSFSLKTTSILREKLWDEVMIHHNYKPLAYFIAAYPIVGEMLRATGAGVKGTIQLGVSGAQAKITGQGERKEDAWDKYFESIKDDFGHGAVGVLKRVIDDITFGIAWDRTRRLADPLLNLAEGKHEKKTRSQFMYMFNDEIEQDVGAAWSTLVLKPIELFAEEGIIETGKAPSSQRHEKEEKKLVQFLFDEVPVSRNWPELQEWLHPKKRSQSVQRYY